MSEPQDVELSATVSLCNANVLPERFARRWFLSVAFQAHQPCASAKRFCLEGIDEITFVRGTSFAVDRSRTQLRFTLPDAAMSARHAQLCFAEGQWRVDDLGSKNGTFRNGVGVQTSAVSDGDVLEVGQSFLVLREGDARTGAEPAQEISLDDPTLLPTLHAGLAEALAALRDVARASLPILLRGESGTGKEVIARAAHAFSGRAGAFVAVNCGAIPASLVEAELFGHKRGAFSGATEDRPGLVRAAHGGTLFLDEIGEMPAVAQVALLRVLQQREVTPVGGTQPVPVDFRIVSATHRDLEAAIDARAFRGDLYARLAGFTLEVPRLAERREDIGILVGRLLVRHAPDRASRLVFGLDAARTLFVQSWPYNVRELEAALQGALAQCENRSIERRHLVPPPRGPSSPPPPSLPPLDLARRTELLALLREHDGNISAVSRAMTRERVQIRRWLARYRISKNPTSGDWQ